MHFNIILVSALSTSSDFPTKTLYPFLISPMRVHARSYHIPWFHHAIVVLTSFVVNSKLNCDIIEVRKRSLARGSTRSGCGTSPECSRQELYFTSDLCPAFFFSFLLFSLNLFL
jgi:hypothetical protein